MIEKPPKIDQVYGDQTSDMMIKDPFMVIQQMETHQGMSYLFTLGDPTNDVSQINDPAEDVSQISGSAEDVS